MARTSSAKIREDPLPVDIAGSGPLLFLALDRIKENTTKNLQNFNTNTGATVVLPLSCTPRPAESVQSEFANQNCRHPHQR